MENENTLYNSYSEQEAEKTFGKHKTFDDFFLDPLQPYAMVKVFIDGNELKAGFTVEFTQKTNDHDTFKIITPDDSFDAFEKPIFDKSRHLTGKNITVQFARFGNIQQTFEGIITNIKNPRHEGGGYGDLHIMGSGNTILLETGKDCQSFEDKTLAQIINEICERYPSEAKIAISENYVNLTNRNAIPYTVQYKESDYEFIKRLAIRHGAFFYNTSEGIVFGNKTQAIVELNEGEDLIEETFSVSLQAQDFKFLAYDAESEKVIEKDSQTEKSEFKEHHFQVMAIIASRKLFTKNPVMQFGNAKNKRELNEAVSLEKERRENLFFVKGKSRAPELKIGGRAEMKDINGKAMETYRVIEIRHYHDGYEYYNEFIGIPDLFNASPFIDTEAVPIGEIQSARVMDNNDPLGLKRVRVQFPWQMAKNQTTPWIKTLTDYAGAGKGDYKAPEIGEEVLVAYESNNAEKPFVLGATYNSNEKSGYATEDNRYKATHSRANNKIVMDDSEKSLLMEDGSQSFFKMKRNRTAEINTDILEINVRKLIINASQSTEITTNDYILNALSRIYVFSNFMKQHINGFMHLFSNKALINSLNTIDIEAKEAKLHGTEKAVMNSDKTALINSKGTAEMHGEQGNNQTNVAQDIKTTVTDKIALAAVYFIPKTKNGEFGFDYFREFDKIDEPAYINLIKSGYKDGKSDLNPTEALDLFKKQYHTIPIKSKKEDSTESSYREYFVPYLTLFSEEFVNQLAASANPPTTLPKYQAELNVFVEIGEELEKLEFEYDDTLFTIDKKVLKDKTITSELGSSQDVTITITCLKDLDSDKEIYIYAYPKDSSQPTLDCKLAGKIIIVQNDSKIRKEEKIVLVRVETDIYKVKIASKGTNEQRKIIGSFSPMEKENLYNLLYQSLIVPTIVDQYPDKSDIFLDLSENKKFQKGELNSYIINEGKESGRIDVGEDCIAINDMRGFFLKDEKNKDFKDQNFFTAFAIRFTNKKDDVAGKTEGIGKRNVILFDDHGPSTLPHEVLHGLGLYHTHRDETPIFYKNLKYIFDKTTTTNIMSYSSAKTSSWRWQWNIINPNISEK